MKNMGQLVTVLFVIFALAACDEMGKGPSKPASSATLQISSK